MLRLTENGVSYRQLHTRLFDHRQPLLSLVRIWGYVLRPGPSPTGPGTAQVSGDAPRVG
jgi:hypothetical protein